MRLDLRVVSAAVLIGLAVAIQDGTLHPLALLLLCSALILVVWVLVVPRPPAASPLVLLTLFLVLHGSLFVADVMNRADGQPSAVLMLLVGLELATGVLVIRSRPEETGRILALFLALHVLVSFISLESHGWGRIDVFVFHHDGADALLDGTNPYTITFPDIYPPESSSRFYGEGLSVDGVLQFGYPYPPINLAPATVGHAAGDVRFGFVLASVLAAGMMWLIGRSPSARWIVLLFVLSPAHSYVLEYSWTEPLLLLALTLVVYAYQRGSRLTPWIFGLFLATKQYAVVLAPLYLLLLESWRPRRIVGDLLRIATAGAVLTLPFALLDLDAFMWSVVELQFHQPFRADALSLLSASVNTIGWPPTWTYSALPFITALGAIALALTRRERGTRVFLASMLVTMLAVLMASKQAFANYYFFVAGVAYLLAAVGTTAEEHRPAAVEVAAATGG